MVESTLVSSCQKKLGPITETLGRLRKLEVIEEDAILIPKIMAIGDRLSEKTSLIESSTGLTLPRRLDMCTKLPLAVKLEEDPYVKMKIELDYEGRSEAIQIESLTTGAIKKAILDIIGETNDIGTGMLTICVKKKGFMGLSIMDLPGLIRLASNRLINQEISSDKRIIILTVGSAQADFEAIESTMTAGLLTRRAKKCYRCVFEQRTFQLKFAIDEDVMATFTYVVGRVKEILDNMLVRGEIEYINSEELNG
ncbi:hypothetical protein LXL04_016578 [Taraxacum kok-saghyz]